MAHEAKRGDLILMGRLVAAVELIGRTGAREIEIAFDDECAGPESVLWNATALFEGRKAFSRQYPYPAQAAEDLLAKLMNGGLCKRCNKTTVVGIDAPEFCCFGLVADDLDDTNTYRYLRTCEI